MTAAEIGLYLAYYAYGLALGYFLLLYPRLWRFAQAAKREVN